MTTIPYDSLDAPAADPDAPAAPPPAVSGTRGAQGAGPSGSSTRQNEPGGEGAASDSEDDDAAPDYRLLGKLLGPQYAPAAKHDDDAVSVSSRHQAVPGTVVKSQALLPKRGEKDFEPTGFRGQRNALEDSRAAMFTAVSSGRRFTKSVSLATWDPVLQRAIVHSHKGILFQSMGLTNRLPQHHEPPAKIDAQGRHWPRIVSRTELTPEETLFLIERGALECRVRANASATERGGEYRGYDEANDELISGSGATGDARKAFALMMGADRCSKEAYGVYSYLRRLGYVVHRAKDVDAIRARAAEKARADRADAGDDNDEEEVGEGELARTEGIIADRRRPLRLVTVWDVLLYLPRRLMQLGGDAVRWAGAWTRAAVAWLAGVVGRVLGGVRSSMTSFGRKPASKPEANSAPRGRGLLGIGGRSFADFDAAYSELQIVPSGHDLSRSRCDAASAEKASLSRQPGPNPFEIFFYAWRPATQFRKTYPPPPEFRIAICDARRQGHIPTMVQFAELFGAVPMPGAEALDEEDAARAREQVERNNASYGRAQSTKPRPVRRAGAGTGPAEGATTETGLLGILLRAVRLVRVLLDAVRQLPVDFYHTATGRPARHKRRGPAAARPRAVVRPNPFPALKSGRRNVVVAVVDQGTTSLVRVGEAEFARWRLAGPPP